MNVRMNILYNKIKKNNNFIKDGENNSVIKL